MIKTKKIISILLTLTMIFSMFLSAVPVSAEEGEHTHAICGETTCVADHNLDGEADALGSVEYTALSEVLTLDEAAGTYSGSLTTGSYYLDKDIDLGSTLIISGEINLCLNGHKLAPAAGVTGAIIYNNWKEVTLNLSDCNGDNGNFRFTEGEQNWELDENGEHTVEGGVITGATSGSGTLGTHGNAIFFYANGTLHMYGGNIVGNNEPNGGAALAISDDSKAFYMYDGTIQGNYGGEYNATSSAVTIYANEESIIYGGLIANNKSSVATNAALFAARKLTMLGGEIRDNNGAGVSISCYAQGEYGFIMEGGSITGNNGGVNFYSVGNGVEDPYMTLGGDADKKIIIADNGDYNLKAEPERTFEVKEMATASNIGITMRVLTPSLGSPLQLSNTGAAYASKFTSDVADYKVAASGEGLVLKVIDTEERAIAITEGIENGEVTSEQTVAMEDEVVTLTVNPADGYVVDSVTATDADGNVTNAVASAEDATKYTFVMPRAAVTVNATFKLAPHIHPVCGATCDGDCSENGTTTHEDIEWVALTQNMVNNWDSSMQGKCYYLTENITAATSTNLGWDASICLNGFTWSCDDESPIDCGMTVGTINLCDCAGGGRIESVNAPALKFYWQGANIYGGTVYSVNDVAIYREQTNDYNIQDVKIFGGNIISENNTVLNFSYAIAYIYGGTFTSLSSEHYALDSTDLLWIYGGTIDGENCKGAISPNWSIVRFSGAPEIKGKISHLVDIVATLPNTNQYVMDGEVFAKDGGEFTQRWTTYMSSAYAPDYFVSTDSTAVAAVNANGELYFVDESVAPIKIAVDPAIVNGTVTSAAAAQAGTEVTFTVTPDAGYALDSLTVTDANGDEVDTAVDADDTTKYTFTMPDTEVTISATFVIVDYSVNISTSFVGGKVTADKETANYGEAITLTATPVSGYEFTSLTVTDAEGNEINTVSALADSTQISFEMPASDVTVSAVFTKKVIESPFTVEAVVSDTTPVTDRDTNDEGMDVYSGDQVYVDVVVNGADYTNADWTLVYDSSKFKYVETKQNEAFALLGYYTLDDSNADGNVLTGKISGQAGNDKKADEFTNGEAVVTYVFEALPQVKEVTGKFNITEAHANTYEMAGVQDNTAATSAAVDVTILLVDENAPDDVPTGKMDDLTVIYKAIEQAGNPYVPDDLFVGATITYYATDDGSPVADSNDDGVIDATELDGLAFRTGLPTWKDVGEYTYYAKVSGSGLATIYDSAVLTIDPATLTPSATFAVDPDVNKVTIIPVLEGVLDGTHNGTVTVKYTDKDGVEQTETLDASAFVYDGESTSVYSGTPIEVEAQASGTFTVTLDYTEGTNDNYTGEENTATVDVDKIAADDATVDALENTITSVFPYDSTAHGVVIDKDALAAITDGTWTASTPVNAYDGTENPTVTNVGDEELVKVVFTDSTGVYNDVVVYVILKVTPADVRITIDDNSKAAGEDDPVPVSTYTVEVLGEDTDGDGEKDVIGTELYGNDLTALDLELVRDPGEAAGTYKITATYVPNANYNVTVINGNFTIDAPVIGEDGDVKIEVVDLSKGLTNGDVQPDYIAGKRLILVYTDLDKAYYGYGTADNYEKLFDVTAAGYKYVDNNYADGTYTEDAKAYAHVYGIVVDAIDEYAATEEYEKQYLDKVVFLGSDAEDAPENIVYDADINLTEELDINDYSMNNGIYNVAYDRQAYIRSILKADYNHNKVVDTTDSKEVKAIVDVAVE